MVEVGSTREAVAAVMVVVLVHITFLMIAKAFSMKEFENYAASEILQALASFVMIGSLILMVNGAMDLAHGIIGGEVSCGMRCRVQ